MFLQASTARLESGVHVRVPEFWFAWGGIDSVSTMLMVIRKRYIYLIIGEYNSGLDR